MINWKDAAILALTVGEEDEDSDLSDNPSWYRSQLETMYGVPIEDQPRLGWHRVRPGEVVVCMSGNHNMDAPVEFTDWDARTIPEGQLMCFELGNEWPEEHENQRPVPVCAAEAVDTYFKYGRWHISPDSLFELLSSHTSINKQEIEEIERKAGEYAAYTEASWAARRVG